LPRDVGLGLSQAPRYYDYQFLFDYPVGGGELSVRWFGSDDRLRIVATSPNDTSAGPENQARTAILFHRLDLVYRKQDGPWDFLITPSINYQAASGAFGGLFAFDFPKYEFSWRAEASRQLSKRAALRVGTELQAGRFEIQARAPSIPAGAGAGDTGVYNVADVSQAYAHPALYTTATIGLGDKFTLYPGARLQYFAVPMQKMAVDPRVRFGWQVGDNTAIKGGLGLYSQIPDLINLAPVWGNPRSGIERAVHTSLGVAQVFESVGVEAEVTGFYKYVFDRSTSSTVLIRDPVSGDIRLENFANQGIGQIFGMELLVRKALTRRLFGWISYTLSKSLIRSQPGADYRPFGFDQPHILTILGVYKLPRGWQIGGRFRLVSGNPSVGYMDGVFVQDGYEPWVGRDERLPTFHQLDLRVDKRFVYRRVMMNVYLDIINVYNRQNGEAWSYSYNFQQRQLQTGLPIVPSLGLRLEF
ncbi:MAG TPA: TonB-dependent receptor, partial [Nannocystis sp.]